MSRGYTIPIQYGPNGCQVEVSGNQTCRETQTLEIIKEFNRVYESKLTELGSVGGGDNLMAKLHLQQDWIRDLTQQNEMLVRAVEELEKEAADRVSMLEERLESGAQVMRKYKDNFSVYLNKTFQNLDLLQNDVCNLVEFIKRARDNGVWNTDELTFYTIDGQSLLKSESPVRDVYRSTQPDKASENVRALEDQLKEMEKRLSNCPKENDLQELNFKLHLKEEELNSLKRRGADIEADNAELRKKFKELEAENNQLKDTIFQANRELEKFYEQANDYVKERDEYKRKFKESTDALSTLQGQLTGEKQNYERRLSIQDDTIRKLSKEQGQMKEELNNSRRQSESLSQAQNETIQALQEAIREHDKASEVVRVMPLTSEESWPSSTTSTMSRSAKTLVNSSTDDEDRTKSTRPSGACFDPPCTRPLKITNIPVASDHKLCSPVCPPSCGEFNNNLKKLESEREQERDIHKHEVDNLKKTIQELEKAGIDSIKVVEDAYEQAKLEVSQQRITITNLQEALKVCKNQLDDLHQRSSGDVSWAAKWFGLSSSESKTPANNNQSVHDV